MLPYAETLVWPGMTSTYATLAPHADETRTGPGQVGVSFSAHRDVVYRSHARTARATYAGGAVVCSGDDEIVWSDVREPTEALEIYPDPALLRALGAPDRSQPWPIERSAVGLVDPVVVGVASTLRRAHVADVYLGETASSTLAHLLARHVLRTYGGGGGPADRVGRLSSAALGRVHDLVEGELAGELTLERLSGVVHLSPFHFARCFAAATVGMPPHRFVTSRRIDHARQLLRSSSWSVERVAHEVGFHNVSHFRRVFRAHVGLVPAAYRAATAPPSSTPFIPRPAAAPAPRARGNRSRSSR